MVMSVMLPNYFPSYLSRSSSIDRQVFRIIRSRQARARPRLIQVLVGTLQNIASSLKFRDTETGIAWHLIESLVRTFQIIILSVTFKTLKAPYGLVGKSCIQNGINLLLITLKDLSTRS